MNIIKKVFRIIFLTGVLLAFSINPVTTISAEAANNSRMISDQVFDSSATMSASDIQAFLNKFPNSCLKNYTDEYPNDYFSYGSQVSAATIIRRASDLWGINPQVMLTKLEQEENLVTGNSGCQLFRYVSAVGFNCPGPTRDAVFRGTSLVTCVQKDENMGFSRQVTKGAWLLKWGKERANGNLSWLVPEDAAYYYGGPMTQGMRQRSSSSPSIYYDGYWNSVYVETGATASLYNYTPFFNQSFSSVFSSFFGIDPATGFAQIPGAVYRAYLKWNGEHFYTHDYNEISAVVASGGVYEGVNFYEASKSGSVPLQRFWVKGNFHFYTPYDGEFNTARSLPGFKYEGASWKVYLTYQAATIPVYRLFNPRNGDHLYTTSASERDAASRIGYIYEGIAFYSDATRP